MEDHLIDSEIDESPKDVILGIMRWWEKKRLLFNMIILSIIAIVISLHLVERPNSYRYIFGGGFIIQSIFYFVFINICYCLGWGVQLLRYYYFKTQYDSKALDYVLFIFGTLVTGFFTYTGYLDYLN
ncbi:MAG: hypothetical protein P8P74_04595 [Crocinitomicaceae bacterium]|nr:hypothetical protein [Crocinitomicaceae bacterium]